MAISAETVEKPWKHDFKAYNYLILLHAKFVTMPELDFFDTLAMYRNWQIYLILNEYLNRLSFVENIFIEAGKLNI